nr:hypothetical protein GCM10020093_119360 [Planobispora longispora]
MGMFATIRSFPPRASSSGDPAVGVVTSPEMSLIGAVPLSIIAGIRARLLCDRVSGAPAESFLVWDRPPGDPARTRLGNGDRIRLILTRFLPIGGTRSPGPVPAEPRRADRGTKIAGVPTGRAAPRPLGAAALRHAFFSIAGEKP